MRILDVLGPVGDITEGSREWEGWMKLTSKPARKNKKGQIGDTMTQRQIVDTNTKNKKGLIFAGKTLENAHTVQDKGPTVHLVLKLSEGDKMQNGSCGASGTESTKKVESLDLSSTLAGEQLTVMRNADEWRELQDEWCKIDEQDCCAPDL